MAAPPVSSEVLTSKIRIGELFKLASVIIATRENKESSAQDSDDGPLFFCVEEAS